MRKIFQFEAGQNADSKAKKKARIKAIAFNWFIIPVFGGMIIGYFTCTECIEKGAYETFWASVIISAMFWITLAEGNAFLGIQLNKYVSWLHEPVKRFILGMIVLLVYTTLASTLVFYVFFELYLDKNFFEVLSGNWYQNLRIPILITVFIALTLHGREFLFSWRQTAINLEKVKSENIATQYESLKNQVNPHFLFNSLNALSSLVYSDQDKAVQFIRKLSEVYRYVLDHQMDEVVGLKQELEFVESFAYLNKIRFGSNLQVTIKDVEATEEFSIPPLAIQMLLENCLKHNIVSKENQLSVDIFLEGDYLVVKNNLNPKKKEEYSSGLGLKNIKSRYGFLTEKPVEIDQNDSFFTVKIPLLKKVES